MVFSERVCKARVKDCLDPSSLIDHLQRGLERLDYTANVALNKAKQAIKVTLEALFVVYRSNFKILIPVNFN